MAKARTPNQKKKYSALNQRLQKYTALVQGMYDTAAREAAKTASATSYVGSGAEKVFKFKNFPETKTKIDALLSNFASDLQALILTSTSEEWKQSNLVQDLLAKNVWAAYRGTRHGKEYEGLFQTNSDALKAFQRRTQNGMNLSQRIWNQTDNLKTELEAAISTAVERGTSAVTLSKQISKYLHDYPKLAKDYKERFGQAINCNDCEYRSIRLARNEINMAYRSAEQERWRQMDFILGYEIKLSGNHPRTDVCDELAGRYPKDFKFLGWHPNCRCYEVPIIASEEDYWNGKELEQIEMPEAIQSWVLDNLNRLDNTTNLPYWFKDNLLACCEKVPNGFIFVSGGEKLLIDKVNGKVITYGTSQEVAKQIRERNTIQANITEIIPSFEDKANSILDAYPDTSFTGINQKRRGSALRKADDFLGGKFDEIDDLVRCNFICRSDQYTEVSEIIAKQYNPYKNIDTQEYVRMHYGGDVKDSYVCRFINVRFDNGVVGEIMLTPYETFAGRESNQKWVREVVGNDIYEKISANAKKHGIELGVGHTYYEEKRLLLGELGKAKGLGDTAKIKDLEEKISDVSKRINDYYGSLTKYCDPFK